MDDFDAGSLHRLSAVVNMNFKWKCRAQLYKILKSLSPIPQDPKLTVLHPKKIVRFEIRQRTETTNATSPI
jgi:hypothetical protein